MINYKCEGKNYAFYSYVVSRIRAVKLKSSILHTNNLSIDFKTEKRFSIKKPSMEILALHTLWVKS